MLTISTTELPNATKGRPSLRRMVKDALPAVREGQDYQQIQHDILNSYDGLTNSEDDGDFIMEAIRIAEDAVSDQPDDATGQLQVAMVYCDLEDEKAEEREQDAPWNQPDVEDGFDAEAEAEARNRD